MFNVKSTGHPVVISELYEGNSLVKYGIKVDDFIRFYQIKTKVGALHVMAEVVSANRCFNIFINQLRTSPNNDHFFWLVPKEEKTTSESINVNNHHKFKTINNITLIKELKEVPNEIENQ